MVLCVKHICYNVQTTYLLDRMNIVFVSPKVPIKTKMDYEYVQMSVYVQENVKKNDGKMEMILNDVTSPRVFEGGQADVKFRKVDEGRMMSLLESRMISQVSGKLITITG